MRNNTPLRKGAALLPAFTLLCAGFWALCGSLSYSSDVYYMTAEGRRILSGSLDGMNGFAWAGGMRLPVQNWLCCAGLGLSEKLSGRYGAYLFYLPAVMASYAAPARRLARGTGSALYGCGAMFCGWMLASAAFLPLRPEHFTMLLTWATCQALARHASTGLRRYLAAAVLAAWAEANVHAAAWPLHLLAWAAYAVPRIRAGKGGARRPWGLFLCGPAMALAACATPYGPASMTYPFLTLLFFRSYAIPEQGPVAALSACAAAGAAFILLAAVLFAKKRIGASELLLIAGSGGMMLAMRHGVLMAPAATACAAEAAWPMVRGAMGGRGGMAEKALRQAAAAAWAASVCVSVAAAAALAFAGGVRSPITAISDRILSARENGSGPMNVLSSAPAGSVLEYDGVGHVMPDGRVEATYGPLNGGSDAWLDLEGLRDGMSGGTAFDVGKYLDENSIWFVVDGPGTSYPYLAGWLSCSPDWELAGHCGDVALWERVR